MMDETGTKPILMIHAVSNHRALLQPTDLSGAGRVNRRRREKIRCLNNECRHASCLSAPDNRPRGVFHHSLV